MIIESVEIENYGAFHGCHYFKLTDRGLTLVLGDNQDELRMNSNGSGKSTIFDALDWFPGGIMPIVSSMISRSTAKWRLISSTMTVHRFVLCAVGSLENPI